MKKISAEEFDKKFENGDSILEYLDVDVIQKVNDAQMRVTVDFPRWMVHSLDKESDHLGISRQALIKISVAEHIKHVASGA